MERDRFHTDDWYRAMTLAERSLAPPSPHTISDVAQRRIERWRSQFPFDTDGYFARRLEADNLSESTLLGLLSEPIQAVRERCPAKAAWLEELEEAFGSPELQPSGFGGFADLTRPLIDRAYRRLQRHIDALLQRYPDAPLGANAAMVAL